MERDARRNIRRGERVLATGLTVLALFGAKDLITQNAAAGFRTQDTEVAIKELNTARQLVLDPGKKMEIAIEVSCGWTCRVLSTETLSGEDPYAPAEYLRQQDPIANEFYEEVIDDTIESLDRADSREGQNEVLIDSKERVVDYFEINHEKAYKNLPGRTSQTVVGAAAGGTLFLLSRRKKDKTPPGY